MVVQIGMYIIIKYVRNILPIVRSNGKSFTIYNCLTLTSTQLVYSIERGEFYIVGTDRLCLIASTACSAGQSNVFPFELKNVGLDTNCHLIIWTIPRGLGLTMITI